MPVIDAHAHIYPEKIASRAVDAVGDFYDMGSGHGPDMAGGGTPEDLLSVCEKRPITHFIVHSVATTAKSVPSINTFLAAQCAEHPEFIGFGTMHQDFPDKEAEVERIIALGLHGIKMHPDTQKVDIDDPRLMELYEIIEGRIPIVLHTGDFRYDYSHPRRLARVLKAFPDLVVDAAHLGGWSVYDVGFDILHEDLINAERLFVDASSSFWWIGQRHMRELIDMWGTDRVMFGSDYPMWDPVAEYDLMMGCGLSDDALERILWHNAEEFSGVKVGC